jgi:hypothetical protein
VPEFGHSVISVAKTLAHEFCGPDFLAALIFAPSRLRPFSLRVQ